MMNVLESFLPRLLRLAEDADYKNKLFSLLLLGPSQNNVCIRRTVTVCETAPMLTSEIRLWFQPSTGLMHKSDSIWRPVGTYDEMFFETIKASAVNLDGQVSVPLLLSRDPLLPNEAVPKSYLDSVLALVTSGKLYVSAPVQSIIELRAFDVTTIVDKQVIFVETNRTLYAYDAQGIGIDDGAEIITPTTGPGRWFTTSPTILSGGLF